ncbi:MAG: hypothetical protein ABIG88_00275 [Patescibacteria group bacterium]
MTKRHVPVHLFGEKFMEIIPYQTKIKKLSGTKYIEIRKQTLILFNQIKRRTKRKAYIRSVYFNKMLIIGMRYCIVLLGRRKRRRYFLFKSRKIKKMAGNIFYLVFH